MASPLPLTFNAASLVLGGYRTRPSETEKGLTEIYFREWVVIFADGDKFALDHKTRTWRRWSRPAKETGKAPHWRAACAKHADQLNDFLRFHKDYIPDTFANRFVRGVPSDKKKCAK